MRRRIVEWKAEQESQEDSVLILLAVVVLLSLGVMVSLPFLFGYH